MTYLVDLIKHENTQITEHTRVLWVHIDVIDVYHTLDTINKAKANKDALVSVYKRYRDEEMVVPQCPNCNEPNFHRFPKGFTQVYCGCGTEYDVYNSP